jgi:predicted AAA+ superfamily ATPase
MIARLLEKELIQLLTEYPVVTLLGPRQAGKTTLACKTLIGYAYANLESPEVRDRATKDPKSFLAQWKGPVIIDEIQRVPQLLSYIQVMVDEKKCNGQFVLTGSHQLQLKEAITQSLAGRTALLQLLPFSIQELSNAGIQFASFEEYAYRGFLPRIYDQNQRPTPAYSNYYQTYVERDVRQLINIKDAALFEKFVKLLAGRAGQLMDYTSFGNDVGADAKTIRHWLSILEASYVIFKLNPYFENFGKRVIKSPKFYFTDVGLLCFLLGIEEPQQVTRDPLVGAIFENLVIVDFLKAQLNQGKVPNLYFYRDSAGNEIDLLIPKGRSLTAIEIKSTATYSSGLMKSVEKIMGNAKEINNSYLVYNGESHKLTKNSSAISFKLIGQETNL